MIYAQILNGTIVNCIVLDDITILADFAVGFDGLPIRIDNITDVNGNAVGIGWTTMDNVTFTPPPSSGD